METDFERVVGEAIEATEHATHILLQLADDLNQRGHKRLSQLVHNEARRVERLNLFQYRTIR